ncbi:hypothetical protein LSH36_2308g00002 [Paralvinella palmiformis]|uniref:Glycosyltransferase 61 catalytic domain-containing protein n=1 Tax=Paralvinella palmiformis TaxID=53620 RepID=A0AAD9IQ33_9ANNE|nr:hypothetical protein LSH36_2308g00002 [Paralvinella palmiformis]
MADAHSSTYFKILDTFPGIMTVFYEDSIENVSISLRRKYYDYISNDCKLLEKNSKGGDFFGRKHYDAECRQTFSETWHGHLLQDLALGIGIPDNITTKNNQSRIVTFLHLIPDGISFNDGDVLYGNLKIVPQKCKRKLTRSCPRIPRNIPKYKEVFTITQFWGSGFYHGTLENLPRIAPYLHFLHTHPHIRIHVASKMKYLNLLHIHSSRLITEPVIHAEILYMPAGGPCGKSPLFTTQVLADIITNNMTYNGNQDTLVLIKRSHKRWFNNHDQILTMLRRHASNLKLRVEVFADNPLPHINKTIEMFSRALVVIAPHGAGEVNLIFSRPGTLLIEGLCYDSDKKTNLCYRNMAQALGLRYYGLIYKYQCMKITSKQIERPLLEYLVKQMNYREDNS